MPEADGKMRFWRNTSVAALASGATATLPNGTLGYEWDEDLDNGFRPTGLVRLSTTIVNNAPVITDYGSNFGSGTANHALTLYKAPSGARVFGAGTVQWAWGLDRHPRPQRHANKCPDAAGDGQLVRRHGRSTEYPESGVGGSHGVYRHNTTHFHDHFSRRRLDGSARKRGSDQRHG